jgi:hypothetical protein
MFNGVGVVVSVNKLVVVVNLFDTVVAVMVVVIVVVGVVEGYRNVPIFEKEIILLI